MVKTRTFIQLGILTLGLTIATGIRLGWIDLGLDTKEPITKPASNFSQGFESTSGTLKNLYPELKPQKVPLFKESSVLKIGWKETPKTDHARFSYEWLNEGQPKTYVINVRFKDQDWVTRNHCDFKSKKVTLDQGIDSKRNPIWITSPTASLIMVTSCFGKPVRKEQEKLLEQHLQYKILKAAGFLVPDVRLAWLDTNYVLLVESPEGLGVRLGAKFLGQVDEEVLDPLLIKKSFDPRSITNLRFSNLFLFNQDYSLYGYRSWIFGRLNKGEGYIQAWVPFGLENTGLTSGRAELFNFTQEDNYKETLLSLRKKTDEIGYDPDTLKLADELIIKNSDAIRKWILNHPAKHKDKFIYHLEQWMAVWKSAR